MLGYGVWGPKFLSLQRKVACESGAMCMIECQDVCC